MDMNISLKVVIIMMKNSISEENMIATFNTRTPKTQDNDASESDTWRASI